MKEKKILRMMIIGIMITSTVFFISCSHVDEITKSSDIITSEEILQVKSIFQLANGDIAPLSGSTDEFSKLSENQIDYYFTLLSEEFGAEPITYSDGILSAEEAKIYFKELFISISESTDSLLGKKYNQFNQEELYSFISEFMYEILDRMKGKNLPDNIHKYVLRRQKETIETITLTNTRSSSDYCPHYYYGITSTKVNSGSVTCTGYSSATNRNDNDCDYEFRFTWPYNYSPTSSLGLHSTSTLVTTIILNAGGINGRLTLGDTSGIVSFLIGAGRVSLVGTSTVQNNLFGNWWLV